MKTIFMGTPDFAAKSLEALIENKYDVAAVFTKADKLGRERLTLNLEAYKKQLLESWEQLPPVFVTSSEGKTGGQELLAYIEEINEGLKKVKG